MTEKWQQLQTDINNWSEATFPSPQRPQSKLAHLAEELEELRADPEDMMEWADCMMLIMDAACVAGISMEQLYDACRKKLEICRKREWGEPDENGVVRHVG